MSVDKMVPEGGVEPLKRRRWMEGISMPWPAEDKDVPEDIMYNILLRLPLKPLVTCTAVCKSWRSLIKNPAFIHTHLNNQDGGVPLLLLRSSDKNFSQKGMVQFDCSPAVSSEYYRDVYSLHLDNGTSFSKYSKLSHPFQAYRQVQKPTLANTAIAIISPHEDQKSIDFDLEDTATSVSAQDGTFIPAQDDRLVKVVGTCKGLVCLHDAHFTTLIWNPCIRKLVILPPPSVTVTRHHCRGGNYAFGYDSRTNDYKVLRSVVHYGNIPPVPMSCNVEIWSLAKGSWKSLSAAVIPANFSPKSGEEYAFVNGALHWIQYRKEEDGDENLIVSFDMSSESFGKIVLPTAVLMRRDACHISRYGESLAFFEKYTELNCSLSMWVMKEYGVVESWAKLFSVSLQSLQTVYMPLTVRKSGEVVLMLRDHIRRYCSVDPKTQKSNAFQIHGYDLYRNMDYFVESLGLLDQPNVISY